MSTIVKRGLYTLIFILVVVGVGFLNQVSIMTWLASKGSIKFISTLAEPILPTQQVDWASAEPGTSSNSEELPNIIIILADDLGWNDISFYGGGLGNGAVQTPNIDRIAAEGVHFSNGYAGNATCAPSRAALLTGRYPTRYGFEFTPGPASAMSMMATFDSHREQLHPGYFLEENLSDFPPFEDQGVPTTEILLPEILASKDYHSILLGKWHLGESEGYTPNDRGFDEFLGFLAGAAMFAEYDDPAMIKSIQEFDGIDQFL
jgi:arylsulfatase A-like enzyme